MTVIVLITCQERNKKSGLMETIVSHGVDLDSGQNVILSCETLDYYRRSCGATYNSDMGEWTMTSKHTA